MTLPFENDTSRIVKKYAKHSISQAAGETEYESKPAHIHFHHGGHIDRINFFVFVMHIRPKLLESKCAAGDRSLR